MDYIIVGTKGFVETVLEELERLENTMKTIKAIILQRKIEAEDLQAILETYEILTITALDLRRAVIETLTFAREEILPPEIGELLDEISIKLFDLSKEYEKILRRFPRTTDEEKIELLKELATTIKKYKEEIETLLEKLREYETY
jgi:archaellum component FlaC